MGPRSWRRNLPLKEDIVQNADQYEFHAIVKALEGLQEDAVPLGEGFDPKEEGVRIQSRVSMSFPNTDVYKVVPTDYPNVPPLLITNFLGIAGVTGPLPTPYTHLLLRRKERRDTAFRDFLDIFNHRLISLLHRIRKKHWIGIGHERPEKSLLGKSLLALIGLDGVYLQERLGIEDRSLLYFTGLLWQRPRSCMGLERLLSTFFQLKIHIEQFQGQWITIPPEEKTAIGHLGQFNALGQSAVIGPRYWDTQQQFMIHIGPVTLKQYINFLKPSPGYVQLLNLVRFYIGGNKDFRLNLILKKESLPKTKLGYGLALGWTSWLNRSKAAKTDAQTDDRQLILTTLPFKQRSTP